MINYSQFDCIELSSLIRKKEIRIREITEAVIESIEKLNPHLNAVIYKLYEQAITSAELLDEQLTKNSDFDSGPLYGIPFMIKNLVADCKDSPFSDGSAFVEGHISVIDAEIIKRYKQAGLVICGRTNAAELGVMPTTEPLLYGPTLNPWNTAYTPGGSSGGSAAAVASGMVPAAHGNDGGGSLRIPASCCGLFALKPCRARNPLGPLFGDLAGGLVCEHVLTRSVRDSAALLDISHGPAAGDPYFSYPFTGSYMEQACLPPEKLRIALLTEVPDGWNKNRDLHTDCKDAAESAASLCEELGHHVEEVNSLELSWPGLPDGFLKIFSCFVVHAILYWEKTLDKKVRETDLEPATWDLYQAGLGITGGEYLSAIENLQLFSRKIVDWYITKKFDILLSPTMRIPPTKIGAFDPNPENPEKWINNAMSFVAFTRVQNITGQPAMSVPLFWNNVGLPIGVHFAGRRGSEDVLFSLAAQLEQARPWFNKLPEIFNR